jgi:hypothetical protein
MLICDNLLQYKRYTLFLREEVEGFYVEFGTKRRDGRYNFNEKIILSLYKDEMDEDLRIRLGKYIYNPKTKRFTNRETRLVWDWNGIVEYFTAEMLWKFLNNRYRFGEEKMKTGIGIRNFERYSVLLSDIIYRLIFEQIKKYVKGLIAYEVLACEDCRY